jgi:hypothetical protein
MRETFGIGKFDAQFRCNHQSDECTFDKRPAYMLDVKLGKAVREFGNEGP